MKNIRISVIYICTSLLMSCTSQDVYNAVQDNMQQECQNLPSSAYENCVNGHSESYSEYERKRQEELENNN